MRFHLAAEATDRIEHVTLYLTAPELSNPLTVGVPVEPGRSIRASHTIDLTQVRLNPFTIVTYWWVLTIAGRDDYTVPGQSIMYEDDRFEWRKQARDDDAVRWTGADSSLGGIALDIVSSARLRLQTILPDLEAGPVRLYVYPSSADLRAAMRLAGRDWVDEHTPPELGVVLVAAVNDKTASLDLVRSISHEMAHRLLYEVAGDAYHTLPVWFNEGVAIYTESADAAADEQQLMTAVMGKTTIPLVELCREFPATEEGRMFAEVQSVSLIRFIQDSYDAQAIGDLLQVYTNGADCEEGVQRILGRSLASLERAWLRDLRPRPPWVRFLEENGLWLLLLVGGFGLAGLLVVGPPQNRR